MDENQKNSQDGMGQDNQANSQANNDSANDAKDYKSLYENMQKALKEERDARKERDLKLSDYEARDKAEQEKKMKEKGKFEELLAEKDKTLSELLPKAKAWEDYQTAKQEALKQELEMFSKAYPKELAEKFGNIIEKMDDETKLDFYKKTMEEQKENEKAKAFKSTPNSDGVNIKSKPNTIQEMIRSAKVLN